MAEIDRAVAKFPTWPTDPLHAVAVLGEEFGELTKAALQLTYEPHKTSMDEFRAEAIQTAAMALRFVQSLDTYQFTRCEQHKQESVHHAILAEQTPHYAGTDLLIYLAGPMRGIPEYNFPAFHAATMALREQGYLVWSPAEHDVELDGFNPATDTAQPMRHYMQRDLPQVLRSDAIVVLPGWENSEGAKLETHVAKMCGIPIHGLDAMLNARLS
jgi:hypothetical protein